MWSVILIHQLPGKWKNQAEYVCYEKKIKEFCEAQGVDFNALEIDWTKKLKG